MLASYPYAHTGELITEAFQCSGVYTTYLTYNYDIYKKK